MPAKLRNTTDPLKGAKKTAPPADTHPYMLLKRGGDALYFKTADAARAAVIKDLTTIKETWEYYQTTDAIEACQQALNDVDKVLTVDGGTFRAVVDPYSGMRYQCQLVLRVSVT